MEGAEPAVWVPLGEVRDMSGAATEELNWYLSLVRYDEGSDSCGQRASAMSAMSDPMAGSVPVTTL